MEAELTEANGSVSMHLGTQTVDLSREVLHRRPALAEYLGRPVPVGIRPEDLQDAAIDPDHPADQRLRVEVENLEALGFELIAHFSIDANQVFSEDALELGEDVELPDTGSTRMTGRFDPKSAIRVGENIEVTITTDNAHFFDPDTGLAIRS